LLGLFLRISCLSLLRALYRLVPLEIFTCAAFQGQSPLQYPRNANFMHSSVLLSYLGSLSLLAWMKGPTFARYWSGVSLSSIG
jgi:hypothetical protein